MSHFKYTSSPRTKTRPRMDDDDLWYGGGATSIDVIVDDYEEDLFMETGLLDQYGSPILRHHVPPQKGPVGFHLPGQNEHHDD